MMMLFIRGIRRNQASSRIMVVSVSLVLFSSFVSSNTASTSGLVSTGLQNLGNTCYINAQIQCAYHIPLVRDLILTPMSLDPGVKKEGDTTAGITGGDEHSEQTSAEPPAESIALLAMRDLFQDMNVAAENRVGAATPTVLCRSLGIPVMQQQDSQEFWKLLIPAMACPPLTDLYQGAFEDYIVALDKSGRERRREEPFLDISLDVAAGSVTSSLESLFGKPEFLSVAEGNGWRPEKDAEKVDAYKGSLLKPQGLPSILQLHLKRFQYDWNTDTTSKVNEPFMFPLELDLRALCKDSGKVDTKMITYHLQAVVVHAGEYESGHYYAYVRPDVRTGDWYRFNDHIVEAVSTDDVFDDAQGGKVNGPTVGNAKGGLLARIWRALQVSSYGYGGPTANAYVLQYVRESDIGLLYGEIED